MNFKLGQTIYAPTKTGNVKTWCCNVQGGKAKSTSIYAPPAILVIVSQTKLDGKMVIRRDVITEGKNIGKSNETTPYEQAVNEAESRYRKKIDQGYKTEIPTDTSKANDNAMGLPKPMLAHPIDKVKVVEFPAHFQPKLDGHRCIVTKQNGKMIAYSRQGKPITTMGHILDYLEDKVKEGIFLDGELYLHGEALQNIGSFIKKARPESAKIVYHVYDIITDEPYTQRLEKLRMVLGTPTKDAPVLPVETILVKTMERVTELCQAVLDLGYEGGILRTPDKGYRAGFRSRTLLKIKKFDDSEFEIVDVIQCKDRNVNDVELKVAKFVCYMPKIDDTFDCTVFGDMHEKDRTWHNRKDFIGKTLTVKHSGYTKEGKPWHPVALRLREDI